MTNISIDVDTSIKLLLTTNKNAEQKTEIDITPRKNGKGFVIEVIRITGNATLLHNLPVEGKRDD